MPISVSRRERPVADALSVTHPQLLIGGDDAAFRDFVQCLFSVAGRLELIRERVGTMYDISGAQYGILMGIRQLQGTSGVSITGLVAHLRQRSNFLTSQTNKLRERGLIRKRMNTQDRRGVLLTLTAAGERLLKAMLPLIASLNDHIFGELDAAEFDVLRRAVTILGETTEDALSTVEQLAKRERMMGA